MTFDEIKLIYYKIKSILLNVNLMLEVIFISLLNSVLIVNVLQNIKSLRC
jgi:hypothetical protein